MNYYILCPEGIVTGGTELAHQLCAEILANGHSAKMYYTKSKVDTPIDKQAPEKYKKYNTSHVKDLEEVDKKGNIVVVPEGITDWVFVFKNASIVVWWMSVDNFYHKDHEDYIIALNERVNLHLVQSEYAADFLRKKQVKAEDIMWLSDYIGELFGQFVLPAQYRKDVVVFNPKKGFDNIIPLMETCDFVEWKPLLNMTEEEMVLNMQIAKLYLDFGNHPGKDRIPREAAACGCCVITNKEGSAAFFEDVPIGDEYKFDMPLDYEAVIAKMKEVLADFDNHFKRSDDYRAKIKAEKGKFSEDTKVFLQRTSQWG